MFSQSEKTPIMWKVLFLLVILLIVIFKFVYLFFQIRSLPFWSECASELLENLEEIVPGYYRYNTVKLLPNLQPHNVMTAVAKGFLYWYFSTELALAKYYLILQTRKYIFQISETCFFFSLQFSCKFKALALES